MYYYIDYSEKPKYKFYCIENRLENAPDGWKELDKEKYYEVLLDVFKGAKKSESDK